ncbi:MAG: ornithine carbamoyltransferase [Verrucomicrobiae bacterium]|nr:ornithine carbamoyltransferase [Verrucomicrobiae bacterium]
MKHLLSIEQLNHDEIRQILELTRTMKSKRGEPDHPTPLKGKSWGLIFTKASTRTRVSFEVAIRELGGWPLYLAGHEIQLGRGETVADTARALSRYLHGVIIRTFAQEDLEEFAACGSIPVINALTDDEHPCQILADLFTIEEKLGSLQGKHITFLGDGDCNVARSWIFAAAKMHMRLTIAAPRGYQPRPALLARAGGDITVTEDIFAAAKDADILYTDVWVSMGKETEAVDRLRVLAPYQLNAAVVARAKPNALVMHCLPAYRGKEISAELLDARQKDIFDQAENRLHTQKAILALLNR